MTTKMTKWLNGPLTSEQCSLIDAYWRATNFLTVGQIYLRANALVKEPLQGDHIKSRLLGHWGTCPGLNLLYVHLNRIIREQAANVIYICGPGHGGPGIVANAYLEGAYTERYPEITQDNSGLDLLFKQFSWPRGIPSHVSPDCPGSLHEGGELGYCLFHAYGAALDNPELIVACVVGDGEAETGPCATSWHGNKFVNPKRDGAVLPVLHLNGAKIGGSTLLSRLPHAELEALMVGYGYAPIFVEGSDPAAMHQLMASALDSAFAAIHNIWHAAREHGETARPRWPMIVLRTPKGWTGPADIDGVQVEGTFRSHQVPAAKAKSDEAHLRVLEQWLHSYRPHELFDLATGKLRADLRALAPEGTARMSANPHANGGELVVPLRLPDPSAYAVAVPAPGAVDAECTSALGPLLRDTFKLNAESNNFRIMCPDEITSNKLSAVFEATDRVAMWELGPSDAHVTREGRVMEILSEHSCQGWLEGYVLTGRHGLFPTYEAFCQVVDSMCNQHAKWLKATAEIGWRRQYPSFNYLLTSHTWRQDHNGYTHQAPGFLDHLATKHGSVANIFLPPDANCLLQVSRDCLASMHKINAIVAGKHPMPQWLAMEAAIAHCQAGISEWTWASSPALANGGEADVVLACAGDVPTLEAVAAAAWLREHAPHVRIRFVNVVELLRLRTPELHPRGLSEQAYAAVFGTNVPVVMAFHGYPTLIPGLVHERPNPGRFSVHGYIEEGSTTTPYDMTVVNKMSRWHLAIDVLKRVQGDSHAALRAELESKLEHHAKYIWDEGVDVPEVVNFRWPAHKVDPVR